MPTDGRPSAHRVSVLLSHHLGVLTYAVPRPIAPGTIVAAPLGGRQVPGVVWDDPADATIEAGRLRAVEPADPEVAIADELRRFIDFAARYTLTPRGAILRTVLRSGEALAREKPAKALALTGSDPERWTPARLKVRAALRAGPMPRTALAEAARVSQSVLAGLIASGVIAEVDAPQVCAPAPDPCPSTLTGRPGRGCGRAAGVRRGALVHPDPPGGRHRVGQDRGLFGGDRGNARRRTPSARADA